MSLWGLLVEYGLPPPAPGDKAAYDTSKASTSPSGSGDDAAPGTVPVAAQRFSIAGFRDDVDEKDGKATPLLHEQYAPAGGAAAAVPSFAPSFAPSWVQQFTVAEEGPGLP